MQNLNYIQSHHPQVTNVLVDGKVIGNLIVFPIPYEYEKVLYGAFVASEQLGLHVFVPYFWCAKELIEASFQYYQVESHNS